VYRWVDLLHHALSEAAARDPSFRESIPGGALPPDQSQLRGRFQELLQLLSNGEANILLLDESFRSLGNQFFRELAVLPASGVESHADLESIDLETTLEKRTQAICRVVEEGDQAAIEFPGNRLAGPARIASALRFVATAGRFTPGELPGVGNTEAKLVLVRRLVRIGLLTIVRESCRAPALPVAAGNEEDSGRRRTEHENNGAARDVHSAVAAAEN
jgi:hypothetical protein